MPRPDSAFAVLKRGDSVLLVRSDRWKLPGGALKRGEPPRAAARREVEEETGLDARFRGLTGVYRRSDGSLAFVFSARVAGPWVPAGPRHEIREQRWVHVRTAVRLLSPSFRERLLDATRGG